MTPKDLAAMLARDVDGIAHKLLPNGKREGKHWVCGSVRGEAGDSFKLNLSGDKPGFWFDFATGEHGDLIDLWREVNRLTMAETLKGIRSHLGITDKTWEKPKNHKPPYVPSRSKPKNAVHEFLISRGFQQRTIDAFKIGEHIEHGKHYVIFPYLFEGVLRMCKQRNIADKKDQRPTSPGQEKCLFGWQAVPEDARSIVICEGEFDAMSFYQWGIPALSVPFGGGAGNKQDWVENEFDNLSRFDEIVLAMDMDDAGKAANFELIKRLGADRCRVATLPLKDANECLAANYDDFDMRQIIAQSKAIDPDELKQTMVFKEGVKRLLNPSTELEDCFFSPWPKMRDLIQFRWSEYTVINGINGHGKSQGAGHILLSAMAQGEKVCIASMELKPDRLLTRLTKQAAGLSQGSISENYIDAIFDWYSEKCWIFECVGTAKADRIIEVFKYARKRYGIKVFLIDSLMKCGFAEDDYNSQKLFIEKLCDFKNEFGVHVFLVTHARKGRDEEDMIGKFDVKGTSAICDLADNVINWVRHKKKERLLEKPGSMDMSEIEEMPDAFMKVEKQRNGDWEGICALWFCKNSYQFTQYKDAPLMQYVRYMQEQTA